MINNNTDDNGKTLEALFEPQNAEILANLEDGPKISSELAEILGIKEEKLDEQMSYLKEMEFANMYPTPFICVSPTIIFLSPRMSFPKILTM